MKRQLGLDNIDVSDLFLHQTLYDASAHITTHFKLEDNNTKLHDYTVLLVDCRLSVGPKIVVLSM